jgi:GrpB-like predicted nucleotidyltransferase (UPF0157 family)
MNHDNDKGLIKIEPYSPHWPIAYRQLRDVYEKHLEGLYHDIQHVGSTSVEGLASKPIIDIDIIIEDESQLSEIIRRLQLIGYDYMGTMGIPGRHSFAAASKDVPLGTTEGSMDHHLYVCIQGVLALENHIMFRDYLRNHPEALNEYAGLKQRLAASAITMEWYVSQKTAFITGVLQDCGLGDKAIDAIRSVNKKEIPDYK